MGGIPLILKHLSWEFVVFIFSFLGLLSSFGTKKLIDTPWQHPFKAPFIAVSMNLKVWHVQITMKIIKLTPAVGLCLQGQLSFFISENVYLSRQAMEYHSVFILSKQQVLFFILVLKSRTLWILTIDVHRHWYEQVIWIRLFLEG